MGTSVRKSWLLIDRGGTVGGIISWAGGPDIYIYKLAKYGCVIKPECNVPPWFLLQVPLEFLS